MATTLPPAVISLQNELTKLPGIGKKTALRLALHLLKAERSDVSALSQSILDVKDKVKVCTICGFLSDRDPCPICTDTRRNAEIVCVVEEPGDVIALEKGNVFPGKYHVLGGALAPLDRIGPEDLRLKELVERLDKEPIKEVIVATNPTPEGEQTAMFIARILKSKDVKVSRIARGIPVGSDLEHADDLTLTRALEGRTGVD